MRVLAVLVFTSLASATQGFAGPASEQQSDYDIIDYRVDPPGSVVFMTRRHRFFGERYTILRTICTGDFPTIFFGSGETAEEATSESMIKGNRGLLIFGTGDDAPRIACRLAGLGDDVGAPAKSGGAVKSK